MIEALVYVKVGEECESRLIMHRFFLSPSMEEVLRAVEDYLTRELINEDRELFIRVRAASGGDPPSLNLEGF